MESLMTALAQPAGVWLLIGAVLAVVGSAAIFVVVAFFRMRAKVDGQRRPLPESNRNPAK